MSRFLRDGLLLCFVCLIGFWWRLGVLGLIDPDEPFYAQSAREMVQSGDWLTPQIYSAPQFEKPIFYYWLVASSFRLFGESEFAGRVPTAFSATLLVAITWLFGRRVFGPRTGLLAGLILATGVEFCVMSRLMLTDIPLAVFLAGAIFSYWLARTEPARREGWLLLHFVCAGLAVLTKGPIGSLIPLLTALTFRFAAKEPALPRGRGFWGGWALYLGLVVPWYALMFARFGWQFWDEFFVRDNWLRFFRAEHPANNHFWYYAALLLGGSLPWMPLVGLAVRRLREDARSDRRVFYVAAWFLSGLIFLTLAQSKLPSYALFLFVPLALLAAVAGDSLLRDGFRSAGEKWLVLGLAFFQVAAAFAAPFFKAARPFQIPAYIVVVILATATGLLVRKQWRAWLAVNATAAVALIVSALIWARSEVEATTSTRTIAALLTGDTPVLSGPTLVRGLIYYTRQPMTVLASRPQPFWAAHPLPVLAWNDKHFPEFFDEHPSVRCVVRKNDWPFAAAKLDGLPWELEQEIGLNVIVRVDKSAPNR